MQKYISCGIDEHIAIVSIDRPKELNALNEEVLRELYDVLFEIDQNTDIKAVILTGKGTKAFAAGADIGAMQDLDTEGAERFSMIGNRTMNLIASMRPFVIAAVNGYALGGGCELAMACDIRVASAKAKLGIPEVTLGVVPGFGGTQRLPRLVGLGNALELLATGRSVDAQEALRIGLVNRVVDSENLLSTCIDIAVDVAKNSTTAVYYGKKAMKIGSGMGLGEALRMETSVFSSLFALEDQKEGMKAFLGKRKPSFR